MFKNYLKVAFRSLNKNRTYAIINILGLALGLAVTILVFMFIKDETSYEKHWNGYERVYRMGIKANMMGQVMDAPVSPSPMANAFRTEFTDVEAATRLERVSQEIMVRYNQTKIYAQKVAYADSTFFEVFDYEFKLGDPKTALTGENSMVITEQTATKLFGEENPIGKVVRYDDRQDYIVKAVIKEPKGRAHFQFDMFMSRNTIRNVWMSNGLYTYVKLKEGANLEAFTTEMRRNFMKKIEPDVQRFMKVSVAEFLKSGNSFEYQIMPIKDIHLHSNKEWEIEQNGNIMYVYVFIGIALLVIIIAGINFMNLSTARSGKRAKEVGVRKVSGASKKMLVTQFLIESLIQSFIALLLAFILVELFLPGFNNILETELYLFNSHVGQTISFSLIVAVFYGLSK